MSVELAVACSAVVRIYEAEKGIVQALRGVDMAARPGTVTAVAGPSGSGKSSLLRILAAIDEPTAGDVIIGGVQVAGMTSTGRRALRARRVGFVHQRPSDNLISDLPIGDQLAVVARYRDASCVEVDRMAEILGFTHRLSHLPGELSGGEQQRVALARAALGQPSVIVADEPTAELDAGTTRDVCDLLRVLAADRGVAVILSTHDPIVMESADHVLLLRDGAVLSETLEGMERTVIDATGRLQLPPEVLAWYPNRRVRLEFDATTNTIVIKPT